MGTGGARGEVGERRARNWERIGVATGAAMGGVGEKWVGTGGATLQG